MRTPCGETDASREVDPYDLLRALRDQRGDAIATRIVQREARRDGSSRSATMTA